MSTNDQQSCCQSVRTNGFSLIETVIVVLLIAILAAVAVPELIQSRRLWRFTGMKQELVANLRLARQLAISQNRRIAFQYDDAIKTIRIFDNNPNLDPNDPNYIASNPSLAPVGGVGPLNDPRNIVVNLAGESLMASDIGYGSLGGIDKTPDTAPLIGGSDQTMTITFNARGDSIKDAFPGTGIPQNKALFFRNNAVDSTAFAISVIGSGGRIKVWWYNGENYE